MVSQTRSNPKYAEFFCGGGMVHAGLRGVWDCAFANDIDPMKCAVYGANWSRAWLVEGDIAQLSLDPLRQQIDMYWASSPCQDFSLAGQGRGLNGARSGVFSEWVRLIRAAVAEGIAPRIIAFENVVGLLTRNNGADFTAVLHTLAGLGYNVGALEIDAADFLPQSRPRLFVVGVRKGVDVSGLRGHGPAGPYHTRKIQRFVQGLARDIADHWVWWHHGVAPPRGLELAQIVDPDPDTGWLTQPQIKSLLGMMTKPSADRIKAARVSGVTQIGMLYKRGRPDGAGQVRQRAEVRFDGLAGCLRTPAGGSSRQTILFVKGRSIRARLLSSREVTLLMGLDASYQMPDRYNQAYQVAGDGVAVPIVRYLDEQLFQPILKAAQKRQVA